MAESVKRSPLPDVVKIRAALELAREFDVEELRLDGLGLSVRLRPRAAPVREAPPEMTRVPTCACGCPVFIHSGGICKNCGPDKADLCRRSRKAA